MPLGCEQPLSRVGGVKTALALMFVPAALALSPAVAGEMQDLKDASHCHHCKMNRNFHLQSRMLVRYADGQSFGVCSIFCAALNLVIHSELTLDSIRVADYTTGGLIDAEDACWVIGGVRPGVMTRRAKWAFEHRKDAERFIHETGGEIATFDDAMRATYEDMYTDSRMIRIKKQIRKMSPD